MLKKQGVDLMSKKQEIKRNTSKNLKQVVFLAIYIFMSTLIFAGEDSPVYSNKEDTSGVNHLFDTGGSHSIYLTPDTDVYAIPYQETDNNGKERQKIILKKDKKLSYKRKENVSKLIRKGRTFSNMAKNIRQKDKQSIGKSPSFSRFEESFLDVNG